MKNKPLIFIGYDERLPLAYEVCKKSIEETASGPVHIYPLEHRDLRKKGLFKRPWVIDGETGNYKDQFDNLNFTNQFSHTRFVTPFYAKYLGYFHHMSMFVDCDFVFLDDVYNLFSDVSRNFSYLSCIHHEYSPVNSVKMDNRKQTVYPKKLWSSLMVFNPVYSKQSELSLEKIQNETSSYLHRMEWIDDKNIGKISERWNFIPDHSETRLTEHESIGAIHYTEGLPSMPGYETCRYSAIYKDVAQRV